MIVQQFATENGIDRVISGANLKDFDCFLNNSASLNSVKVSLASSLQKTLDPHQVLEIFSTSLFELVSHSSFRFVSDDEVVDFAEGETERSSLSYAISSDGLKIGDLFITRKKRFSRVEIALVEDCISALYYPLKNALLYKKALQSALSDPLTKLNNRAMLDKTLAREGLMASRHDEDFSVIIIDVDDFKQVNDSYGHQAGDYVLTEIAAIMKKYGRSSDMLFRYAGDEFVITLSKTDTVGAQMVADRIRATVSSKKFVFSGKQIDVSISLGVASIQKGESTSDLFMRADQSLYQAKEAGRNMVCAAC